MNEMDVVDWRIAVSFYYTKDDDVPLLIDLIIIQDFSSDELLCIREQLVCETWEERDGI